MLTLTVPAYSSLPGAPYTLYLNFGGSAPFDWNNGTQYHVHGPGGPNTPIPPFDWDGNTSNFSSVELTDIQQYWSFVAEKYSPFNVNVTTVNPGNLNDDQTEEVIIGGSPLDWFQPGNPNPNSGISDIGGFTDSGPNIEFFFANFVQNNLYFDATNTAHESGHGFGLVHEQYTLSPPPVGNSNYPQYYPGDPNEGPIMGGVSLNTGVRGIWWETNIYPGQNSTQTPIQDELSVLSSVLGYRPDDPSPVTMTADAQGNISGYGGTIIHSTGDLDQFRFTANSTTASFTINNAPFGGMLAPTSLITTTGGQGVVSNLNTTNSSCSISTTNLTPGQTYFLDVSSSGGYGNIGQFSVTGSVSAPFAFMNNHTLDVVGYGDNSNNLTLSLSGGTYTLTDTLQGHTETEQFLASLVTSGIDFGLGNGTNTVDIGKGSLSGIASTNLSFGSGSNNSLTVDDSQYHSSTTYTLGFVAGSGASITRTGGVSILYANGNGNNLPKVNLIAGDGADIINATGTQAGTTTSINTSGGEDAVNVEGPALDFFGNLSIDSGGDGTINVDDSTSLPAAARSIVLSNFSTPGFGAITGYGAITISYNYADTDSLDLDLNTKANTVTVRATGTQTTFVGGNAQLVQMDGGTTATLSGVAINSLLGRDIINHGNLTIANCSITGNHAGQLGGGIINTATLKITDSTLTSNYSSENGGAIENLGQGTINLINSRVSGNLSTASGGGVYNQGNLAINNCTFTLNGAASGAALFNDTNGTAIVGNSIFWADLSAEVVNHSVALISYSDVEGGATGPGNVPGGADPLFDSNLQLQTGSPCINAGNNNDVVTGLKDLAGNPRIVASTVDMGAYENQGAIFLNPTQLTSTTVVGATQTIIVAVEQGTTLSNAVVVKGDTSTVTLSLLAEPSGGALVNNPSGGVAVSGGYATFSNISFNVAGTYRVFIGDSAGSVTGATATFTVSAAGCAKLVFFQPAFPYTVPPGGTFPSVIVHVEDSSGNLDPVNDKLVLTFNGGSYTSVAAGGIATFVPVPTHPSSNTSYPIEVDDATNPGTTNVSSTLTVDAAAPTHVLAFGGFSFANPIAANSTISGLTVTDTANGAAVTSDLVTLSITPSQSLPAPATTNGSGVATFSNFSLPAGDYTLTATDAQNATVAVAFTVKAPIIPTLVFGTQPVNITADQAIQSSGNQPIVVYVEDGNGHILNGTNGTTDDNSTFVTMNLAAPRTNYGFWNFTGLTTGTAVHGVVSLNHMFLATAYTAFQLVASARAITRRPPAFLTSIRAYPATCLCRALQEPRARRSRRELLSR